jgi:hypothetical protein
MFCISALPFVMTPDRMAGLESELAGGPEDKRNMENNIKKKKNTNNATRKNMVLLHKC